MSRYIKLSLHWALIALIAGILWFVFINHFSFENEVKTIPLFFSFSVSVSIYPIWEILALPALVLIFFVCGQQNILGIKKCVAAIVPISLASFVTTILYGPGLGLFLVGGYFFFLGLYKELELLPSEILCCEHQRNEDKCDTNKALRERSEVAMLFFFSYGLGVTFIYGPFVGVALAIISFMLLIIGVMIGYYTGQLVKKVSSLFHYISGKIKEIRGIIKKFLLVPNVPDPNVSEK